MTHILAYLAGIGTVYLAIWLLNLWAEMKRIADLCDMIGGPPR